jgi:hypothetical protein
VEVKSWHPTHNNHSWVIKPDSSCGIEICTPILKGEVGLESVCRVIDVLKKSDIKSDNRCSLHIHVNIADLTPIEIGNILACWIKCEHILLSAFPSKRKNNRYCQFIGLSNLFNHDQKYSDEQLIQILSTQKYYTANTFHYKTGKRQTIEIRPAENAFCLNAYDTKCWIRLILHFFDRAKNFKYLAKYEANNPWSGLVWLDVEDVFIFLGFDGTFTLTPQLQEVKKWFLNRLQTYCYDANMGGIWANDIRDIVYYGIEQLLRVNNSNDL